MPGAQILVDIAVESLPNADKDRGDPMYATGNLDFLVDDTLVRIGQFEGALLLLPTLEILASGISRMRRGDLTVEVAVVGDSTPFWIATQKRVPERAFIVHREMKTPLVDKPDLDRECEGAAGTFLAFMRDNNALRPDLPHIRSMIMNVTLTWPALRSFLTPGITYPKRRR
jgi:hypothetical protein